LEAIELIAIFLYFNMHVMM